MSNEPRPLSLAKAYNHGRRLGASTSVVRREQSVMYANIYLHKTTVEYKGNHATMRSSAHGAGMRGCGHGHYRCVEEVAGRVEAGGRWQSSSYRR